MVGAAAHLTPNAFKAYVHTEDFSCRLTKTAELYLYDCGANEQLLMAARWK